MQRVIMAAHKEARRAVSSAHGSGDMPMASSEQHLVETFSQYPAGGTSAKARLQQLHELLTEGLITKSEYDDRRGLIVASL